MPSEEAKQLRRALSSKLTEQLNTFGGGEESVHYPLIRIVVIRALSVLNQRLAELDDKFHRDYLISAERKLLKFYMKGGNAFSCVYNREGREATEFGGGNSDWDSQIVVDPWAPVPIQTLLYSLIEEMILDEMLKAGLEIAKAAHVRFPQSEQTLTVVQKADGQEDRNVRYSVERDKRQTVRRVYDYNRIGLWMNDASKIRGEEGVDTALIPGILLNDAIPPFMLYRLGYTWHSEPAANQLNPPPKIKSPILMELIDVTLPRRNTVEAIAAWEDLEQRHLEIQETKISVFIQSRQETEALPLPTLPYHLRENATMLCEIADGSSRHKDKLLRRLLRFEQIFESKESKQQEVVTTVSAMAGEIDLFQVVLESLDRKAIRRVQEEIKRYAPDYKPISDASYELALRLMYVVASRRLAPVRDRFITETIAARKALKALLGMMNVGKYLGLIHKRIEEAGYSDDLVLRELLRENGYIDVKAVKLSGIDQAVVLRVNARVTPNELAAVLKDGFTQLGLLVRESLIHFSVGPVATIIKDLAASKIEVRSRSHNTIRPSGISYEHTLVVFSNGRARICITATSATRAEAPFHPLKINEEVLYCSLPELASQRKVAAALIEDYTIRTAISNQYEILKRLLPNL